MGWVFMMFMQGALEFVCCDILGWHLGLCGVTSIPEKLDGRIR